VIVPRLLAVTVVALTLLSLQGCAIFQRSDPLQVTVAGIEPMEGQGQGLELRLLVKLRVQNPNDAPIDYNGVAVEMIVQGKTFATGVSDASGTSGKITYEMTGKLNGSGFNSVHFRTQGEFDLAGTSATGSGS